MFHLIELVKLRNKEPFAYHFSSSNVELLKKHHNDIFERFSNYEISTHVLSTDYASWSSVIDMDPYFSNVKCIENIDEFGEFLSKETKISSSDICSYLLGKIGFSSDFKKMEKLLYFVYSDFLEMTHKSLFPQKFDAWQYGPVEPKSRYCRIRSDLPNINESIDKLLFSDNSNDIFSSLEKIIKIYGNKSTKELIDLTHKNGSPWQKNYVKGLNKRISDSDILKYHNVEKIGN
ncbi:DUF4065 domain-containing protein [Apilactobacillus apisilvae]|uniref:DUF4065 domain-containing protein n=1 Tax=Apilactobacillus apisilvae TaxID=2923364 RepID=A0ABY4PGB7_9LACO|nr:type II toxin-antitoxin system antitoxin SocA domain-containing protein [Apilactobacillus apisilvae]UQS84637.1 DUF4065 domain-containing protein [Apilactobacillus apisilvae]